jgi:hypothetical protein
MLRRVDIDPILLSCPDQPIPVGAVAEQLEQSATEAGCPTFGLRMAETRTLGTLGLIGLLFEHAATPRETLLALVRYQGLMSEAFAFSLVESEAGTVLRVDLVAGPGARQAAELVLGFACRMVAEASGWRWRPDGAHFVHPAPADLAVHEQVFRCPLVFGDSFNGLVATAAGLDIANPKADPHLAAHAADMLDQIVPAAG